MGTNQQWVGIGLHPTDGSTYFLGSDDSGYVVKITDDGSSINSDIVANTNTEIAHTTGDNRGTFAIPTFVYSRAGPSFYACPTIQNQFNHMLCSTDLLGLGWRSVGNIRTTAVHRMTTSGGEGETILDASTAPAALVGQDYFRPQQETEHLYGSQPSMPVDHCSLHDIIWITEGGAAGSSIPYKSDDAGFPFVMEDRAGTGIRFQMNGGNGRVQTTDGTNIQEWHPSGFVRQRTKIQFSESGIGVVYTNQDDLTSDSADRYEIRIHDGPDGNSTNSAGHAWYDRDNSQWVILVDGNVID